MNYFAYLISATALIFLNSCSEDLSSKAWMSRFAEIDTPITNSSGMNFNFSATDSNGNMYLSVNSYNNNKWRILKSTDQGSTWTTSDNNPSNYSYGYRMKGDSLGNVFAVGATSPDNSNVTAVIRKFNGTSWSEVFTYQMEAGQIASFAGVAVDASDNIYVTGSAKVTTPTTMMKTVVFKSTDHGSTWTLIDTFAPYEARIAERNNIIVHGTTLYASGSTMSVAVGSIPETWVRKSTDGGTTWTTIYENWGGHIEDMVSWNNGIVILLDYDRGTDSGKIKVLATEDDFVHISELYSYAPDSPRVSYAEALAVDQRGYLYASGTAVDNSIIASAFIAVTRDGTTWEKILDKRFTGAESESPDTIFFNSTNKVFCASIYSDDNGVTSSLRINSASIYDTTTFPLTAIGNGSANVSPIPASTKIIYVTSQLTAGNLGVSAAAAKTNADSICNSDKNKPTYATGSFKALLVATGQRIGCTTANCGGGAGEHTDWPLAASQQYVTRTGLNFGTTNATGLFTAIDSSNYLAMYAPMYPWSGLEQSVVNYWVLDSGVNCLDWTSNSISDLGWTYDPTQLVLTDFYSNSGSNWGSCDEQRPLVCVEQ